MCWSVCVCVSRKQGSCFWLVYRLWNGFWTNVVLLKTVNVLKPPLVLWRNRRFSKIWRREENKPLPTGIFCYFFVIFFFPVLWLEVFPVLYYYYCAGSTVNYWWSIGTCFWPQWISIACFCSPLLRFIASLLPRTGPDRTGAPPLIASWAAAVFLKMRTTVLFLYLCFYFFL